MELSDYFRILRQRGWIIILLALLTTATAFGLSKMQTPEYKSTVRMLITSRPDFGQTQATKELRRDFATYLNSQYRAANVINRLEYDVTPGDLMGRATISPSTDSNIIIIEIKDSDPDIANRIARAWGEELLLWREQENADFRKEDRIEAQFLDEPQVSLNKPKTKVNAAAGAMFGALLGVLAIFLIEWRESGILRRTEDIERYLDVPVIGTIPK